MCETMEDHEETEAAKADKKEELTIDLGNIEGYEVSVVFQKDGLTMEELWALYEEAQKCVLFQKLAQSGEELEK